VSYTANALNEYSSVDSTAYSYNSNGCLTGDGTWTFGYDSENQLTSATDGTTTVNFVYDPMHRQIQKAITGGDKPLFVYSGWQRIADYDGAANPPTLQHRYVYGTSLDEILLQVSGTSPSVTVSYFYQDRLRNVVATADTTGTVTSRYKYSPFGDSSGLTGTIQGFTGQRFDPEMQLYYFKRRYYSPKLGRFLQPDPAKSGFNLYRYVNNDPANYVDPEGLVPTYSAPPTTLNPNPTSGVGLIPLALWLLYVSLSIEWEVFWHLYKTWEETQEEEEKKIAEDYNECKTSADNDYAEYKEFIERLKKKCKTAEERRKLDEGLDRARTRWEQRKEYCKNRREGTVNNFVSKV
jgi:RHS repeat-associated protein